jgi:hypothetical protein
MALTKIHLNLLDISGPSWKDISPEAIERLTQALQSLPVHGKEPDRYTITGVLRADDAIGGFFATEYDHEAIEYDDQKHEKRTVHNEWEKTVFLLLPKIGKLLLQSRQYPKGLTTDHVINLFKPTFQNLIREADLGDSLIGPLTQTEHTDQEFIEIFEDQSNRVVKISVTDIHPSAKLEGLTYYNPEKERNEIIAGSHGHDFEIIDNITAEAGKKRTNLHDAHFMQSAVRSGTNQEIQYFGQDGQRHKLLRAIKENYEIVIDLDVETIREEDVRRMALMVLEQYGLAEVPEVPPGPVQMDLFGTE